MSSSDPWCSRKRSLRDQSLTVQFYLEIITGYPSNYTMDHPLNLFIIPEGESIGALRVR